MFDTPHFQIGDPYLRIIYGGGRYGGGPIEKTYLWPTDHQGCQYFEQNRGLPSVKKILNQRRENQVKRIFNEKNLDPIYSPKTGQMKCPKWASSNWNIMLKIFTMRNIHLLPGLKKKNPVPSLTVGKKKRERENGT